MDLRKITYFVAIAECRSFTKAAAKLRVAQPALSRHMKLLEEEAGLPLFVRVNQTLDLTEAGQLLLNSARELIRGFDQLKVDLGDLRRRQRESVSLGLLPSLADVVVPRLLEGVSSQPDGADIQIREGAGTWVEELVANNELDLALIGHQPTNPAVEYEKLADESIAVLGTEALLRRMLTSPANAQRTPVIMTRQVYQTILGPWCRDAGLEMRSAVEIDALEVVKRLILNGRGCALLPVGLFHAELAQGQLAALRIAEVSLSRPIVLGVPAGRMQSRAARRIAGTIREQIARNRNALKLHAAHVVGTISLASQLCGVPASRKPARYQPVRGGAAQHRTARSAVTIR